MKVLIVLLVILGTIDFNEGCVSRRNRPSRPGRRNHNIVQPTTPPATLETLVITQATTVGETTMLPEVITTEVAQPTEERNETPTVEATTRIPEVITTERAEQIQETTTIEPMTAEATTRIQEVITTERVEPIQETTTIEPMTAEATTRIPEVITTERAEQIQETTIIEPTTAEATINIAPATRPTSLFRFRSKTLGLKSIPSTKTCVGDFKGECKATCNINEFVQGRFDCLGVNHCCVTR